MFSPDRSLSRETLFPNARFVAFLGTFARPVVSPATHGSAGLSSSEELGTQYLEGTGESTLLLSITVLAFDFTAVLYTCTTVASRVAANACATHLR